MTEMKYFIFEYTPPATTLSGRPSGISSCIGHYEGPFTKKSALRRGQVLLSVRLTPNGEFQTFGVYNLWF